ncbi:type II secretory pathway pseudopilin PulG [Sinorhizobium kostiense]|uniref:Type II secretory pathway pseudopilin PulG n=1 Tax=Sinorhizobium kostiense TaxID=76747 RepID=A0ABS4R6T8_9HYPH|nr:type II secretory pathway pseudopilin PulG [Sinorhizobium kostiense]
MRRDMQRFMMIELIAVIAALAVVSAIMVVTLLPG